MDRHQDPSRPHPTDGATGADPANLDRFQEEVAAREAASSTQPGGPGVTSANAATDANDPTGYGGAASPTARDRAARAAFGQDTDRPAEGPEIPASSS